MNANHPRSSRRENSFRWLFLLAGAFVFLGAVVGSELSRTHASEAVQDLTGYRVGERLTYSVSIGRLPNAAYAELYTVSRGRIGDKDAVEMRARFKTLDLASATFFLVDENRTTFVSSLTGLPLYTSIAQNAFGLPKEKTQSFLVAPTAHADLLTTIHRIRHSGAAGSLTMQENDKVYAVTWQSTTTEKHKTDAGEYETTLVPIQSEYFTELGITDVRVNLSNDDDRVPVLVRFQTAKGAIKASLASVQVIDSGVEPQPTPAPIRTPVTERPPKPTATPLPYIDNQPLAAELAFAIGEQLDYRVLLSGQHVATMRLSAKERKLINRQDTLVLEATFSDMKPGSPFAGGDFIRAYVDPDTLAPRQVEMKFGGALRQFANTVRFDREGSRIVVGAGGQPIDSPVGTHSLLSLIYAARSFNLKPSRDLANPINDTRVAVFWESAPYVFTMRPSAPAPITIEGTELGAQLVTVNTKNQVLDGLSIRFWLGTDDSRLPLRFAVGPYQADLILRRSNPIP